jgi:hypothetical protein
MRHVKEMNLLSAHRSSNPIWSATQSVITEIRCRKRPAYPGQRTRQFSVRRERVAEVRRWLSNYQKLKKAIEAVCELNHDLLRPERAALAASRAGPNRHGASEGRCDPAVNAANGGSRAARRAEAIASV